METAKLCELMNDLAAINLERSRAYEEASLKNHLFDVELRTTFALLANQSRQNNYLLNVQLEKLMAKNVGVRPVFGDLYQEWKNSAGHFKGENRQSILESSETGELFMVTLYEKVLENPFKSEWREMLQNQLRGMQSSLSTIKKTIDQGAPKDYRSQQSRYQ